MADKTKIVRMRKTGWVSGYLDDIRFNAKVYDVGSHMGIDGGRISKLDMIKNEELIAQYDRGWNIYPKIDSIDSFYDIVDDLENLSFNRPLSEKLKDLWD